MESARTRTMTRGPARARVAGGATHGSCASTLSLFVSLPISSARDVADDSDVGPTPLPASSPSSQYVLLIRRARPRGPLWARQRIPVAAIHASRTEERERLGHRPRPAFLTHSERSKVRRSPLLFLMSLNGFDRGHVVPP